MNAFNIKPATRTGVKPLVGIFGRSGSGKTMSALLLARGLVGQKGRIVLIDSESGRGSIFSDLIPGGYNVLDLEAPFSPDRYLAAIEQAEANADCVVVDSLSHEHNGEGGLLDMQEAELDRMAGDNYSKREACKMAAWIKPKFSHNKFIGRLLRLKTSLICCLRGEEKTHITKGPDGKSKVITDEFSSPIFDKRFLFELLICMESISKNGVGGYMVPVKITHPAVAQLLPKENEQISIKHGEALAQWCSNPSGSAPTVASTQPKPSKDNISALKRELWALTKHIHGENRAELEQHLWDESYISDMENLDGLTEGRLQEIVTKIKSR